MDEISMFTELRPAPPADADADAIRAAVRGRVTSFLSESDPAAHGWRLPTRRSSAGPRPTASRPHSRSTRRPAPSAAASAGPRSTDDDPLMNSVLLDGGSLPRLLAGIEPTGLPATLAAHEREYGPMPRLASEQLITEVGRSGLRGRGGADFPTARKLEAVAGRRAVSAVVVNGSETEPASQKDRVLMTALPHLVIDGAVAAAEAVGAREVIIKLGPDAKHACDALLHAISERDQRVAVSVVEGPKGYVAGEESAVINWLNGGRPKPVFVPPRPFERGYRRRPTLIVDPETLAQLTLGALD